MPCSVRDVLCDTWDVNHASLIHKMIANGLVSIDADFGCILRDHDHYVAALHMLTSIPVRDIDHMMVEIYNHPKIMEEYKQEVSVFAYETESYNGTASESRLDVDKASTQSRTIPKQFDTSLMLHIASLCIGFVNTWLLIMKHGKR